VLQSLLLTLGSIQPIKVLHANVTDRLGDLYLTKTGFPIGFDGASLTIGVKVGINAKTELEIVSATGEVTYGTQLVLLYFVIYLLF
jgi:hypothetical protein